MQRVLTRGRTGATRRAGRGAGSTLGAGIVLVGVLTVSACTSAGGNVASPADGGQHRSGTSSAPSSSAAPAPAAVITILTAAQTKKLSPTTPVTVDVAHGTLTSVTLTNKAGKTVKGAMNAAGTGWSSSEELGYAKTYSLTATARNGDGVSVVKRQKITTLTPDNLTMPYLDDIYGSALDKGATYGVGMVISASFDESIPDKAAAAKALVVRTTPHVDGAWYWTSDSVAHWRPKAYYAPGTKVSVDAKVYGTNLGGGLYGEADATSNFVIGAKHYSVANAKTHEVQVYFDNKLQRTMDTSMGQGGYVEGKNGEISLWTMPGIYTVINHENPAYMSSDSYGLPASSPYGYAKEAIPYGTKISTDGIYLHELDATVWAQGHENVSHGCLNLNYDNAKWFYNHSKIGDVVEVVHSGGPKIEVWQGGDWSVPWSTWAKGGVS